MDKVTDMLLTELTVEAVEREELLLLRRDRAGMQWCGSGEAVGAALLRA